MTFPLYLIKHTVAGHSFTVFEPDKETINASYQNGEIAFPYWSQVWPAAMGLAQFILQQPQYIAGKTVLELAAGLGLPSLVAATTGAAFVTASDYMPQAVAAIQKTFTHHKLTHIAVQPLDWTKLPDTLTADVLLLSDVSYDEKLFCIQETTIRSFLQKGTTVIISTPQRLIAKQAVEPLLPLCRQSQEIVVPHHQQSIPVSIFVLQQ